MTSKSSKIAIALKVTAKVKNEAQIMTLGLTLKAMSDWNDFGLIR